MGQVVLLQQLVEGVAHIVGGVGVPVLPGEYVVVVYVVLAEVVAVVLFLLKQDLEQPYRIVCQGKAAEAGCVFRLVLLHDLRDPGHGVPYGQRLHRKVDALAKAMVLLLEDREKAQKMGINAKKIRRRVDKELVCKRWLDFIMDCRRKENEC